MFCVILLGAIHLRGDYHPEFAFLIPQFALKLQPRAAILTSNHIFK